MINIRIERIGQGRYLWVYHSATEEEKCRMIANGYRPYEWELERNPEVYCYARGDAAPRFPVPTKRTHAPEFVWNLEMIIGAALNGQI